MELEEMMRTIKSKATQVVGWCVLSTFIMMILFNPSPADPSMSVRRSLIASSADGKGPTVYPWARQHLRPLDTLPDSGKETVVLWTTQRSGGTTARSIYECMGLSIAHKAGIDPRFNYQGREKIVAFNPWPGVSRASYVNVDTTSTSGIDRAKRLGLISSGVADMVITNEIEYAVKSLFDINHKGRALALFRHPVERLVSKFYYLQTATWEGKQYRPAWKRLDIQFWALNKNPERNHLVKKLAGKAWNENVTETDLRSAMRTVEKRFIVGLTDKMEESVRRFNVVLGIDASDDDHNKVCLSHFFEGERKANSITHPNVVEGTVGWTALAKTNDLDMRLYDHIERLFYEQKEYIDLYQAGYRYDATTSTS